MLFYLSLLALICLAGLSESNLTHIVLQTADTSHSGIPIPQRPRTVRPRTYEVTIPRPPPLRPAVDLCRPNWRWHEFVSIRYRGQHPGWRLARWFGRTGHPGDQGYNAQGARQVRRHYSTKSSPCLPCTSFDQARLIRHNRILAQNGIDPSGVFPHP